MSIFDDDNTTPDKSSEKSPYATDSRDEILRDELFGAPLSPNDLMEPELDDFEPLDDHRNRNLSHSLSGVQDDGPARTPAPKPARDPEVDESPFMNVNPAPNKVATESRAPKQQPVQPQAPFHIDERLEQPAEPKPARKPAPQAEKATAEPRPSRKVAPPPLKTNLTMATMLNWALLALLLILAVSQMIQMSELDKQQTALNDSLDKLTQSSALQDRTTEQNEQFTALQNELNQLKGQVSALQNTPAATELPTDAQELIKSLAARMDGVENNLQLLELQQVKATKPAVSKEPKATATNSAGWFINIAVLSDLANANNLRDKVRNLGADAKVDAIQSKGRTLHRVRAYGYASQSAAERDAQRLQTALNLEGLWVTK
ncbi:SPOR domain-containing protein [Porticoccaceae bacterium LTM1]|nr:SPOR domain-containing protein [Porticoccaceae bacterium LTM1]